MAEEAGQGSVQGLTLDQKTVEVLVAHIIPTSKYFETRFDHLQYQVNEIKEDIKQLDGRMEKQFVAVRAEIADLEGRMEKQFTAVRGEISDLEGRMNGRFEQMNRRFEEVYKRFEQVDKRFEQVDKRFEQVDKRFAQVEEKLDKIIERIDRRIDEGLRENRTQMVRLFTFAMTFSAISMIGLVGKMLNLF
jgi:methyl-accepting chemotaxis protein